jgi:hypothetical protein
MFHPSESFPLTPDLFVYSAVHQARGAVLCKIGSHICKTAISPGRDVFIALRPLDTLNYWLTLYVCCAHCVCCAFFCCAWQHSTTSGLGPPAPFGGYPIT